MIGKKILEFIVQTRVRNSCGHLLESLSLNTIALVTLELLHRPIAENNIDCNGRGLLAASNLQDSIGNIRVENHTSLAVSSTSSLHILSPANLFIKSFGL